MSPSIRSATLSVLLLTLCPWGGWSQATNSSSNTNFAQQGQGLSIVPLAVDSGTEAEAHPISESSAIAQLRVKYAGALRPGVVSATESTRDDAAASTYLDLPTEPITFSRRRRIVPPQLVSGVPEPFSLPAVAAPSLAGGFWIHVPAGSRRLDIALRTDTPGVNVDLYVRYGSEVGVSAGSAQADYKAESSTGVEFVTITSESLPPLRPGTYFVALGLLMPGTFVTGTLEAHLDGGVITPRTQAMPLTPGIPLSLTLPAVDAATLFGAWKVDVPWDATRLEIRLDANTPSVYVELFARLGQEVELVGGQVVADHRATGPGGNKNIVVSTDSSPTLESGTYYIAIGLVTTGTPVEVTLTAILNEPPQLITLNAVLNAASFEGGAIAPGQIVSLFGEDMGPAVGVETRLDSEGRIAKVYAGVQVMFDGIPAPLFYVREDQINAQAPYGVAGQTTTQVEVIYAGERSNSLTLSVEHCSPALFMFLDGSRRAIVTRTSGALVFQSTPAKPGEIVIFWATGEGITNPPSVEGQLAAPPYATPVEDLSLTIGGAEADILWAGSAPGFAGLLQVNARIPQAAPGGDRVPVVLTIGGFSSPADVTLAVEGGAPTPPPSVSMTADPASIATGETSRLTWTSENAISATLSPGFGSVATTGFRDVSPSETTTYSITVQGPGGSASASATVTVQQQPGAFTISNLQVGPVRRLFGDVTLPISVGYVDPTGTASCETLQLDILLTSGGSSIHRTGGVTKPGQPCETSGTLDLSARFTTFFQSGLTVTITISLTNSRGHKSNVLTGSFQS